MHFEQHPLPTLEQPRVSLILYSLPVLLKCQLGCIEPLVTALKPRTSFKNELTDGRHPWF